MGRRIEATLLIGVGLTLLGCGGAIPQTSPAARAPALAQPERPQLMAGRPSSI